MEHTIANELIRLMKEADALHPGLRWEMGDDGCNGIVLVTSRLYTDQQLEAMDEEGLPATPLDQYHDNEQWKQGGYFIDGWVEDFITFAVYVDDGRRITTEDEALALKVMNILKLPTI